MKKYTFIFLATPLPLVFSVIGSPPRKRQLRTLIKITDDGSQQIFQMTTTPNP